MPRESTRAAPASGAHSEFMQTAQARMEALELEVKHLAHVQQTSVSATVTGYPAAPDMEAALDTALSMGAAPPPAPPPPPLKEPSLLNYALLFGLSSLLLCVVPAFFGYQLSLQNLFEGVFTQDVCNTRAAATVLGVLDMEPWSQAEWPQCTADIKFKSQDGVTHLGSIQLLANDCNARVGSLTPVCYRATVPSQYIAGDCPPSSDASLTMNFVVFVCLASAITGLFGMVQDMNEQASRRWTEYQVKQAVQQAVEQAGGPASECTRLLMDETER